MSPRPATTLLHAAPRIPRHRPSLRPRLRPSLLALLILAVLTVKTAWAQDGDGLRADGGSAWGLGLGVAIERKPYRGIDDETRALPILMFENRWVSLLGPRLDLKLPSAGPVSFRLRARYAGDGYEADDSPDLRGMDERKAGFWAGGAALWRTPYVNLSAELLGDVSGHSKGTQFKLSAERGFKSGAFELTPRVAAIWLDSKYVDYYYGVRPGEATAGRAPHAGESTLNVELGLRANYRFAPRQSVFVDVSGTALGSGIKRSPLVERSNQAGVRLGYLYRF